MAEQDELGGLVRSLGDAQEGAHAEGFGVGLFQQFEGESGLPRQRLGAGGHLRGGEEVAGLVGEVAGEVRGFGEDRAGSDAAVQRGLIRAEEADGADLVGGLLGVQVAVEAVEAQADAFRGGLGEVGFVEMGEGRAGEGDGEIAVGEAAGATGGGGGGVADAVQVDLLSIAQAGDEDAPHGSAAQAVHYADLVALAGQLAVPGQGLEGPVQEGVDRAGRARGGDLSLGAEDEEVRRRGVLGGVGGGGDVHGPSRPATGSPRPADRAES